jgi:hypothetical protein
MTEHCNGLPNLVDGPCNGFVDLVQIFDDPLIGMYLAELSLNCVR